ncbi:UNVERIFIED_CONTAM: hypothetical protein FKN15_054392 [Acipenser sinensis]
MLGTLSVSKQRNVASNKAGVSVVEEENADENTTETETLITPEGMSEEEFSAVTLRPDTLPETDTDELVIRRESRDGRRRIGSNTGSTGAKTSGGNGDLDGADEFHVPGGQSGGGPATEPSPPVPRIRVVKMSLEDDPEAYSTTPHSAHTTIPGGKEHSFRARRIVANGVSFGLLFGL